MKKLTKKDKQELKDFIDNLDVKKYPFAIRQDSDNFMFTFSMKRTTKNN